MINSSMWLFHDERVIHLLVRVHPASYMERRVERCEIHTDHCRSVSYVLSVILRHLAHSWIHGLTLYKILEMSKPNLSAVKRSLDNT